jgi:hypothetical protein
VTIWDFPEADEGTRRLSRRKTALTPLEWKLASRKQSII